MNFNIVEISAVAVFFIGFCGLIVSRNIIKSIIYVVLVEAAVIMFWLGIGYRSGLIPSPPIGVELEGLAYVADPLPQALTLTAIIIGLSLTAVNITIGISLFRKHRSADWDIVKMKSME